MLKGMYPNAGLGFTPPQTVHPDNPKSFTSPSPLFMTSCQKLWAGIN